MLSACIEPGYAPGIRGDRYYWLTDVRSLKRYAFSFLGSSSLTEITAERLYRCLENISLPDCHGKTGVDAPHGERAFRTVPSAERRLSLMRCFAALSGPERRSVF